MIQGWLKTLDTTMSLISGYWDEILRFVGSIKLDKVKTVENQLGASGFVVNNIVLWNSLSSQTALELIEAMGDDVLAEDAARLWLLKRERPARCRLVSKKWQHIQALGRYKFIMDPVVAGGDLRPLHDPNVFRELETDSSRVDGCLTRF
jgi:Tn3 transposase DDE domain